MIHVSKLVSIAERKDPSGKPIPFSFKAIALDGHLIDGQNCVITSSSNIYRSVNVKFLDSGEIRKIKLISFIEFNGKEVFI